MSVKSFIQTWSGEEIRSYNKEDRMLEVYDNMYDIVEFYVTKGHNKKHIDTVNRLFKILCSERFISTVEKMGKKKSDYPLIPELAILFSDLVDKRGRELGEEDVEKYVTIVDKLLKPKVKEISAKVTIPKSIIAETLVVLPDVDLVDSKYINVYVGKALRKLYVSANLLEKEELEEISIKDLKKLFKQVFGKSNFDSVLLGIALERRDLIRNFNEKQLIMWGKMSELLLTEMSDMKKKTLKNLLTDFIERRDFYAKKNNDFNRRIDFLALDAEENYEKISKVAKAMVDEDKEVEKFLH